jgi:uncharacterized protein
LAEKIILMRTEGASAPAPESDRSTTTWNHWTGEDGRLLCGIWESEPESWTIEAGDGFIIPPGFKGTWETVEKVRKHYVIVLPKP